MPTAVATEQSQSTKSLLLRQSIFLFGLSMIAVLWIGLGWKLQAGREAFDQKLNGDSSNLARAFEESVLRTIQQVDLRLQVLRQQVAASPDPTTWRNFVSTIPLDDDVSFQMAVTDAKGILVTSSIDHVPAKPLDLSDRDHIRTPLRSQTDELFISRPLLGRVSKQWSVNITRPIRGKDGQLLGVAVASLSHTYLTRVYNDIALSGRSAVLVMGADGYVRASTGKFDLSAAAVQDSGLFRSIRGGVEGHYVGAFLDSSNAIVAWRKIRSLPLYVAVAIDKPAARAPQSRTEIVEMVAATVITLMIGLATSLIVRSQHGVYLARVALQQTARQVEAKSRELETMLDSISQGMVMVDRQGELLVANRRALQLLGHPTIDDLRRGIGPLMAEIQALAGRHGRGDVGATTRVDLEVPGGRILETARTLMADGNVVVTFADVTLAKRRQHEIEMAWQAADSANRAKSQFLSTMSHEMRTPLNGMIGALDLMAKTELDPDQRHFVETALQSGEALLVHINDVLDFSKMEAGKLVLEPAPFNLRHLVDSVLKIVAPQAEPRGNALNRDVSDELPASLIGDPIRVRQILLNLVGNAVKFTRDGTVTVRVRRVGGTDEKPDVMVAIEDNGQGIPADRIGHLFQEFSMVDASLTRKQGGTGLGLAICKRLVEAMGGEIGVDSRAGEGSRFWFRVPLERAAEVPPDEKPADPAPLPAGVSLDVLLVDDNLTNQMVASRMLVAAGHLVRTASDGLEALQAASKKRYDVILMDISMPEMDGIESTKRIRKLDEPYRSVPIIALTANAIAGDRERFLAAGMNDYLTKPIRRATIEARLARFAGEIARQRAAATGSAMPGPAPEIQTQQAEFDAATAPVIDPAELRKLAAETSPDIVPVVVEQFVGEAAVRLEEIQAATARRDADGLRKAAHALAGASASVGALRLRAQSKAIELACAEGRGEDVFTDVAQLPALLLATTAAVEKVAREHDAAHAATVAA